MASFGLLEQSEEDALHASRLLNVEERLFKRLTKRLLAPTALTRPSRTRLAIEHATEKFASDQVTANHAPQQWREDACLDFAAFDSNIVRVQFLLDCNERERQRYAEERLRIIDAAQAVRENNTELHERLKETQATLSLRRHYDELANQITDSQKLRPRDEQHGHLEKLNVEIAELERESREYSQTWAERREQFGRIVEEGEQMLRLIRDEKEEAERKEGMEDVVEGDGEQSAARSGIDTPKLATPSHIGEHEDLGKDRFSAPATSVDNSRASSPISGARSRRYREGNDDTAMGDAEVTVANETDSKDDDEEGQLEDDAVEGMDVT